MATFVYYLTAFVASGFFLTVSYHIYTRATQGWVDSGDQYFAIVSVLPPLLMILPLLLAAFLLRRLARRFGWTRMWQWVVAGTVLGVVVLWGLGYAGLAVERAYFPLKYQAVKASLMILLLGPMMVTTKPFWLPVPALALTSWLLFAVHRVFRPRPAAPSP